jgi:hypothetical protein
LPDLKRLSTFKISGRRKEKGYKVDGCYASELTIICDKDNFSRLLGRTLESYNLIYLMVSKRRWEWYTTCLSLAKIKIQ